MTTGHRSEFNSWNLPSIYRFSLQAETDHDNPLQTFYALWSLKFLLSTVLAKISQWWKNILMWYQWYKQLLKCNVQINHRVHFWPDYRGWDLIYSHRSNTFVHPIGHGHQFRKSISNLVTTPLGLCSTPINAPHGCFCPLIYTAQNLSH